MWAWCVPLHASANGGGRGRKVMLRLPAQLPPTQRSPAAAKPAEWAGAAGGSAGPAGRGSATRALRRMDGPQEKKSGIPEINLLQMGLVYVTTAVCRRRRFGPRSRGLEGNVGRRCSRRKPASVVPIVPMWTLRRATARETPPGASRGSARLEQLQIAEWYLLKSYVQKSM